MPFLSKFSSFYAHFCDHSPWENSQNVSVYNFFFRDQKKFEKMHFLLVNYRAGKKKAQMFFCSEFLNFWDTKTLIPSKDRIFDIVFGEINFKMRKLLV